MALWRLAVVALVLGLVFAVAWARNRRSSQGAAYVPPGARFEASDLPADGVPGPLFFVLFTSRFCGACGDARDALAKAPSGLPVMELDLSKRPALARRYGLSETPTVLLVDDSLRVRFAHAGVPSPEAVSFWVREAFASAPAGSVRGVGRKRSA